MRPPERIELRVHGDTALPTLIYLPGLHGDWTLVTSFRHNLAGRVRFVETAYPLATHWTLEDYARGIIEALGEHQIHSGWILGESFGSQVAWALLKAATQHGFRVEGIILAGGFVRYFGRWQVKCAQRVNRALPLAAVRKVCQWYAAYARFRHRHAPETLTSIAEFVQRRTRPGDREALCQRYTLIYENDATAIAAGCSVPVFQLFGFFDPVVPWVPVRLWLRRNCPACRDWKMIWGGDHNVLGTAPKQAAAKVLRWMGLISTGQPT